MTENKSLFHFAKPSSDSIIPILISVTYFMIFFMFHFFITIIFLKKMEFISRNNWSTFDIFNSNIHSNLPMRNTILEIVPDYVILDDSTPKSKE